MIRAEYLEQIARLNWQLNEYLLQRRRKVSAIEDTEYALRELQKIGSNMETQLRQSLSVVSNQLDQRPYLSKFRFNYLQNVRNIFFNSPSSTIFSEQTEAVVKSARIKLSTLEDDLRELDIKIRSTEEAIQQLSLQTELSEVTYE